MMKLEVSVIIEAPVEHVWKAVIDIENSPNMISGIEKVEVLKRGKEGLTGFVWKETRIMFGKMAEETMTIIEAVENSHYVSTAESHGSRYTSRISVSGKSGRTELKMEFGAVPQTLAAKIIWGLTGFMFKGATKKALQSDLEDIRKFIERRSGPGDSDNEAKNGEQ